MHRILMIILVMALLIGSYGAWAIQKPLPLLMAHSVLPGRPAVPAGSLSWPAYGSAAVGALGYGLLASNGPQQPLPTASVAKVMTALAVLQKKPLKLGESGPQIILSPQDVAYYQSYLTAGGSVVAVNDGETLSEYQALQALLLPSANNLAETIANWAFGSVQAYTAFANTYAKQLGMTNSDFSDASGFASTTTSTADDLVLLGEAAISNPVIGQIVAQSSATLPVAGLVQNVNSLLGQNGINGIKTGNTTQAGGVYLASGLYKRGGHLVTIVSAVMAAPTLKQAMRDTVPLLVSAQNDFTNTILVKGGEIVGYYNTPWQTSDNAIVASPVQVFGWQGAANRLTASFKILRAPLKTGQDVGLLNLIKPNGSKQQISLRLQSALPGPTWQWRFWHP